MSGVVERLRGPQGWAELECPPEIRPPFDLEEVLKHHFSQDTIMVTSGTKVSQHSSTTSHMA